MHGLLAVKVGSLCLAEETTMRAASFEAMKNIATSPKTRKT
jgi:hypothetical protein